MSEEKFVSLQELMQRKDLPSEFTYPYGKDEPRRGYISTGFTVNCGNCNEWLESYNYRTKSQFAADARKGGWKNTREKGWLCPNCQRGVTP